MSYILDALRKADAQRERDPARGIHAQPVAVTAAGERARPGARTALWAGLAVGLVLLAYVGWHLTRATPVPPPAPAAALPAPAAAPVPAPVAEVPAPPQAPAPATAVMPPAPPAVVQAPPPPAPAPAPMPAQAQAPAPAAAAAAAPAPQLPVAAGAEVRTGAPPDAPKLAITGGVYSADKSQRMLIVNGQVFNEGAEPAPGVRLEQIRPNTAVLSFRGQRYTVGF